MSGFLLDTVTISELRKKERANSQVLAWQEATRGENHWLSVVTIMEIRTGILQVRRRNSAFSDHLCEWLEQTLLVEFVSHLLPVTLAEANLAAAFRIEHQIATEDALIASTAKVHGLTIATRNVDHLERTGVPVVNPWDFDP